MKARRRFSAVYAVLAALCMSASASAGEFIFVRLEADGDATEAAAALLTLKIHNAGPPPLDPLDTLVVLPDSRHPEPPLTALAHEFTRLQGIQPPAQVKGLMISGHSTGDVFFAGANRAFTRDQLIKLIMRHPSLTPQAIYLLGCYTLTPRQAPAWLSLARTDPGSGSDTGLGFVFGYTRQGPGAARGGNIDLMRRTMNIQLGLSSDPTAEDIRLALNHLHELQNARDLGAATCGRYSYHDINGTFSMQQIAHPEVPNPPGETNVLCDSDRVQRARTALESFRRFCANEELQALESHRSMRDQYGDFQYAQQCLPPEELVQAPTAVEFLGSVPGPHFNRSVCRRLYGS